MATTKEKAPKTGGTPKAGKDKAAPGATDAAPKAAEPERPMPTIGSLASQLQGIGLRGAAGDAKAKAKAAAPKAKAAPKKKKAAAA